MIITAEIDSLEIKIESESSAAVERINSLTQALQQLKSVLASGFKAPDLSNIGEGASQAEGKVRKKYKLATKKYFSSGTEDTGAVKDVTQSYETLKDTAQTVSNMKVDGPEIDPSVMQDVEQATAVIDEFTESINDTKPIQIKDFTESFNKYPKEFNRLSKLLDSLDVKAVRANSNFTGMFKKIDKVLGTPGVDQNTITQYLKAREAVEKYAEVYDRLQNIMARTRKQMAKIGEDPSNISPDKLDAIRDAFAARQKTIQGLNHELDLAKEKAQAALKALDKPSVDMGGGDKTSAASEFSGIANAMKGTGMGQQLSQVINLVSEIENLGTASAGASGAMAGMGGAAAGAGSSIAALAGPIGVVVAALQILKQKFEENKEFLQSDRSIWTDVSFENAAGGLTNLTAALMIFNPLIKPAVYGLRSFIQPGQELAGVLGNLAESGFKKAGSALREFAASGFKKAGDAVKAFGSNVGKGFASVAGNIGSKFIKPFQSAIETVSKWKQSIGRLAFYRLINAAIRTVTEGIREGIDNLYQYSNAVGTQFAPAMNSLASSSLYLKNSLAAMAAPLIQAVAPAIDFVISKLVTLLNLIGAVFAALTGQGFFTKATKGATEFGDAVGGASGAAKELKDYMLGIDELNVINDDSGGGGGGGGAGGLDYGSMFEEVELPDWAQRIKDAIEKGDWYGAGSLLAEKLNSVLDQWDPEPWGKELGENITHGLDFALGFLRTFNFDELGGKLADAINGLGDGINFTTLGNTIGAGWNAVFNTANGFFKKIKWEQWGQNIADAINGWQDEVDWELIGETFSNGILGLLTAIDTAIQGINTDDLGRNFATALNNIDWYDIAYQALHTIIDGLKAAAEAILSFATTFDWTGTATAIANGINDAIGDMSDEEWNKIGQSISTLIKNAVGGIGTFLEKINWSQIGNSIAEILKGVSWDTLLSTAGSSLAAGFNGFISAAYEIINKADFWDKLGAGVKAGVKAFFNDFKIGDALDALGTAIGEGFNLVISAVNGLTEAGEFWSGLQTGIQTGITNFFDTVEPGEMVAAAQGLLQRILDTAIAGISALASNGDWFAELGTAIGTGINDLVANTDWTKALTNLAKLATDIITGLGNALGAIDWEAVRSAIKTAMDNIEWGPLIDAAITLFAEAFKFKAEMKLTEIDIFTKIGTELGSGLGRAIDKGLSSIPIFGWIYTTGKKVLEFMGILGEAIVAVTTGQWNQLPGIVGEAMDLINSTVNTKGIDINGAVNSALKTAGDLTSSALEAIKKTHSGALGSMETTTDTKYTNMRTLTTNRVGEMKSVVDRDFPAMQKTVTDADSKIDTDTSDTWNNVKKTIIEDTLPGVTEGLSTSFNDIKLAVQGAMSDSESTTSENMGLIKSTAEGKSEESLDAIKRNFGKVDGEINTALNTAKTNAGKQNWSSVGENLIDGVSYGVRQAAQRLINSVTSNISAAFNAAQRAARINSPSKLFRDGVGKLLGLGVAVGVEDSTPDVLASIYDLNADMQKAFTGLVASDMPMEIPVHKDITAQYAVELMGGDNGAKAITSGMKQANEDMTQRLLEAFRTVVDAINGVADRPIEVSMDGKKTMQAVEKAQRQRGANILAGGVMA